MAWTLTLGYLAIALVCAVVVYLMSNRIADEDRRPAAQRIGLSLAAGLVWPLLVLGLMEFSSFAIYVKAHANAADKDVAARVW